MAEIIGLLSPKYSLLEWSKLKENFLCPWGGSLGKRRHFLPVLLCPVFVIDSQEMCCDSFVQVVPAIVVYWSKLP